MYIDKKENKRKTPWKSNLNTHKKLLLKLGKNIVTKQKQGKYYFGLINCIKIIIETKTYVMRGFIIIPKSTRMWNSWEQCSKMLFV